jgi:FMN-dependent oxidoreductase (nitrilotriacetate monooxygenase family)
MNVREGKQRKPIHLAAHFPGVNNTTVWTDPRSGSQIEFDSFVHLARTAERGLFDFFFLAEGLRLREHRGRIYDLDVVGRPDTFTVLAALAAVTERLGLTGTINTTFNEPFEVARQFATLDHLSGGRAGWNIVTSSDAFTGQNFRRGGFLDHADRYRRAEEFLTVAQEFWRSWAADAVVADVGKGPDGTYVDPTRVRSVEHHGAHFDVRGVATLPAGPQGDPVLLQAGDSDEGRNFGARHADALFTLHGSLEDGQRYYADVKGRAVSYGRDPDQLKVFPAATFVLGDTAEEAADEAVHIRHQQVSGATAIAMLEQIWGQDLSGYDPDGPLPEFDPTGDTSVTQGRVRHGDPVAVARKFRERAEAEKLSIRELIIAVTSRQQFVGTAADIADEIDRYVQADACDGFILVPHLTPHGLDDFVEQVVPLLQERGAFRTEYTGDTLREQLGLADHRRKADA